MKPGKILLKDKAFIRPDEQSVKVFSYLCQVEDFEPITMSQDFTDYRWVSLKDLPSIPHVGIDGELTLADALYDSGLDISKFQTESIREDKIS